MTHKDASQRTQALMATINQTSIAARVKTREPLTLDFVIRRITRGDRDLALGALDALTRAGVLVEETNSVERVYHLADEYKDAQ